MKCAKQGGTINVELIEARTLIRQLCTVCGGRTERVNVLAEARTSDGDIVCRVCESCLNLDDIDKRLESTASHWQAHAKYARGLKGRLKIPTYAEWEKHNDEIEAKAEAEARWEYEKQISLGDDEGGAA